MRRLLAVVGLALVAVLATPAAAQAESISSFDVDLDVTADGLLHVRETIQYDFGFLHKHGIYRNIPVRYRYDNTYDRVYRLSNVRVSGAPGTPVDYERSTEGADVVLKIGDANRTITGQHRYVISYDVRGALNAFSEHDELYWNAIGNGWEVPINQATVRVATPAEPIETACFAGGRGSSLRCAREVGRPAGAEFAHRSLPPYGGITVVVGLPKGAVSVPPPILEERWSIARAFDVTPMTLGLTGLLTLLCAGLVGRLLWLRGRDRRYVGGIPGLLPPEGTVAPEERLPFRADPAGPVEFSAPRDLRPAQAGVLIDERADPLDVTATIVDLAVRKYLRIEELPREGWFAKRDWRLVKLRDVDDTLLTYERTLHEGLFDDGDEVLVSALRESFYKDLRTVQDQLYADCVRQRWFTRRPDHVRGIWFALGLVAALVGAGLLALLAWRTHYGLVGIPLLLAGLALLIGHRSMPARTPRGSAALSRVLGFREFMRTADTERLRFAEAEGTFAAGLPYAIIFGMTERWAKAFSDLGAGAPDGGGNFYWYAGPHGWTSANFADSMDSFMSTSVGAIVSTPASSGDSGFGGGGFSGGGGGGGGGGSW